MTLKEQFFDMLASLDVDEKQQLRQALDATPSTPDDKAEQQSAEEKSQTASDTVQTEETPPAPVERNGDDSEDKEKPEELSLEVIGTETQVTSNPDQEQMQASETPPQLQETEEQPPIAEQSTMSESEPLTDVQGEEMPIDYRQIVDGLNAKIMALEVENASLKAKIGGAFGLTSKANQSVAVNRLYDNDTSDIHFKK